MIGAGSVSQQYLLASKARSKLLKCANAGRNKDFDLRVLVGHANMLDRLMDNIDQYNNSAKDGAVSGSYDVEYISSDEDSDEENKVLSSDSSSEEDEDEEVEEDERSYAPLGLMGLARQSPVVTVTIDHCLDDGEEYDSDSESDLDEHSFEMDLSMMPLAIKSMHEPITV